MIKVEMVKVKSFFTTFKNSIIPHYPFYHTVHKKTLKESFSYFLLLIIALNILLIAVSIIRLSPMKVNGVLSSVISSLRSFPKDLNIFIQNGNLLTTYNRPYFLWLDHNNNKYLLAAVDKMAGSASVKNYGAYFMLDSNQFIYKKNPLKSEYATVPLKLVGEHRITKGTIDQVSMSMKTIQRFFWLFYIMMILLALIALPILSFVATLLYLIIACGIVYTLYYLLKQGKRVYPFKTIFQLGLYAVTLPVLLDYALSLFHIQNTFTPFLFLFLLTAFVIGAVHEAHYKPSNR